MLSKLQWLNTDSASKPKIGRILAASAIALVLSLGLTSMAQAQAGTVTATFDDLLPAFAPKFVPDGYAHPALRWQNVIARADAPGASGAGNGIISPAEISTNNGSNDYVVSIGGGTFDAISAFGNGYWNDGLTIEARGYQPGDIAPTFTAQFVVDANGAADCGGPGPTCGPPEFLSFAAFGFTGLHRLEFSSFGGTRNPLLTGSGSGESMVIENLELNIVPEPGTAMLLGLGLGALAAARRRDEE